MKKIFLVSTIILISVLMISCSKNDNSTNDKIVNLSNRDYITKLESTVDEILRKYGDDYDYNLGADSRDDENVHLIQADENSDYYKSIIKSYKDNQTKYKQISESLSKFEIKEEKVNEMHKLLIKSYNELSEAYKEKLDIEATYNKSVNVEEMEDKYNKEDIKVVSGEERGEAVSKNLVKINNTIENTWTNLGNLLKVEF